MTNNLLFTLALSLLIILQVSSQNDKIPFSVSKEMGNDPISLFDYERNISNQLKVNSQSLVSITQLPIPSLSIPIKTELLTATLQLQFHPIYSSENNTIRTFRGSIIGQDESLVTMTCTEEQFYIYINDKNNYLIEGNRGSATISIQDPIEEVAVSCGTEDEDFLHIERSNSGSRAQANCLELYVETDYDLYLANGSDVAATTTFATSVINHVAAIYAIHNVPVIINQLNVSTTPDAYGSTLQDVLTNFVNNSQGLIAKVGFLMSGKTLGGGISQGIGGYCSAKNAYPGPFAIAGDIAPPDISFPTYSYNVQIVAHELGHVLGLRHTHACVWNGNNTQIDDCGNVYASNNNQTPEGGSCYDTNSPILPAGGTIMSFCNLLNGQSIDFAQGFGSVAGEVLYDNFINAPCDLGLKCVGVNPINDFCLDAIPLKLSNTCQYRTYDNILASSSGATPGFSCGTQGAGQDIWFTVEMPSSGAITISTDDAPSRTISDIVLQAYSGSCSNLSQLVCDDNSGSGQHALLQISGRTPGELIYIRMIEDGSNASGNFNLCAYDASVPCHPDFNALITFYNDMNGSSWTNDGGWIDGQAGTNCDVCNWYGVVCDEFDRVAELNLPSNNLSGGLSAALTSLPRLTRLNLYNNGISSSLPAFVKDISLLQYLDLGSNQLAGILPIELGESANLRTAYLDNNQFSGSIPANLDLSPLTLIWLNDNNLSGCLPNTFQALCDRNTDVRLANNTLLPYGGNYDVLCNQGLGADFDADTFCGGSQDCDDMNPLSFPGASEICDGLDNDCDTLVDETLQHIPNTWIGPSNNWNDPTAWSTGITPKVCHDVTFDPAGQDSLIVFALDQGTANSINIGINGLLKIQNFSSLNVVNGGIVNNGYVNIIGQVFVDQGTQIGFDNNGTLELSSTGFLTISNVSNTGLYNRLNGTIINSGTVEANTIGGSYFGINNYGVFTNNNSIISTNNGNRSIIVRNGSLLTNSILSNISIN